MGRYVNISFAHKYLLYKYHKIFFLEVLMFFLVPNRYQLMIRSDMNHTLDELFQD
jgi:hypothetical protein